MVGKPPPCAPCDFKPPEHDPDAVEFLEFWAYCQTQWRTGFNGVTGLDYTACKIVSETLDYPWNDRTLRCLRALEDRVIGKQHNSDNDKGSRPSK